MRHQRISANMASANTIFAIIMVSITPVSVLCIVFNFIVICCCVHHSVDLATCTLLLGRLGHACGLVIFMATYQLENWVWSRSMCQIFVWLWVSCWVLDVLTNLFFLAYNSSRLGHDKANIRYHIFVLLMACWGLSILAGAMTFLADSMFHNYDDANQMCTVGLSVSENPVLIGTMLIIIIGGLLITVLTISVSAESRAVALKIKLLETRAECLRTPKIQNGDVTSRPQNDMELNGLSEGNGSERTQGGQSGTSVNSNNNNNNNNDGDNIDSSVRRVYTWAYVDKYMKDVRHIHAAATATTIFLNMLPQLVLYSIDILSGTLYAYTHHILIAVGMIHSVVLPVTFCTAGIRYKDTSKHLVRGICGTPANTAIRESDPEENVVFHIRDVTTDSSDTNANNDVTADGDYYKRGQLQVLSMHGEPSLASVNFNYNESIQEEDDNSATSRARNGVVVMKTSEAARLSANNLESYQGSTNLAYEHDISGDPDYVRSLSDGSIDYGDGYDSEEDWGSWDSDSETWSNLYDYSDIEEVLDARSATGSPAKLSPAGHARRPSHVSQTGSRGRRRKLSTQPSWPPDSQSPRPKNRERRRSEDRKRKRRSRRRGRRESKGIGPGLEATMNLGIASAMISRNPRKAHEEEGQQKRQTEGEDQQEEGPITNTPDDENANLGSSNIPPPPPPPDMDTLLRVTRSGESERSKVDDHDDDDEREKHQSAFASELVAAASKLKHVSGQEKDIRHQLKVIRTESGTKSGKSPRRSSSKLGKVTVLPDRASFDRIARKTSNIEVRRTGSKLSKGSNSSLKGGLPISRKHSSGKSHTRASTPPSSNFHHLDPASSASRPISAPQLDPALANMTLNQIITNPFLKDMLRRSLESLDSADDDRKDGQPSRQPPDDITGQKDELCQDMSSPHRRKTASVVTTSSSEQSEASQPANHWSKASEMAYYQIPSIDSDFRYRPRKPLRRGKHAFKAAAQTVIIQEFLKKAATKPITAPKPNLGRTTSRSSWANDSDVIDV